MQFSVTTFSNVFLGRTTAINSFFYILKGSKLSSTGLVYQSQSYCSLTKGNCILHRNLPKSLVIVVKLCLFPSFNHLKTNMFYFFPCSGEDSLVKCNFLSAFSKSTPNEIPLGASFLLLFLPWFLQVSNVWLFPEHIPLYIMLQFLLFSFFFSSYVPSLLLSLEYEIMIMIYLVDNNDWLLLKKQVRNL